jgi:transcription elongation factor Elf1
LEEHIVPGRGIDPKVSFFATLAVLNCPACGHYIPHGAIEFSNQPSIAVHVCKKCGIELQIVEPELGGPYQVERLRKN